MSDPRDLRTLARRRTGWIVAAALAPLAVLLFFQYRWLSRLEQASEVAHRATLDNYLAAIVSGVELHYRSLGERALNVPAAIFTADRIHKAQFHFEKKAGEGAKRLFVVPLVGDLAGQPLVYDAATRTLAPPPWSSEARAIQVAVAPWKVLAMKHGTLERPTLQVEDRVPGHRIVLNPITEEDGRVVGLAGLFVDPEELERVVLPRAVSQALPKLLGEESGELPVVVVRDPNGRELVYQKAGKWPGKGPAPVELGGGAAATKVADDAVRALGFPFRDHQVGIRSRHRTPAAWARRNFQINLALSAVLSAVVAGGVLFALRAAAREMRLSQMKSDFVSNVSHELRTPLASIRVFGELLRLGRVESAEKVREYGELIETESRRLTGLIDNILDLARIESGRKSYRLVPADLEEVVAETLRTFRVSLAPAGFRISYAASGEPLPRVAIDAAAIAQTMGNLLDNAVKYSGAARDVEVAVRREGGFAVVSVADHGIGIPRAEQAKVFERFHRVSTGQVHDVKGSGLGLAIVRHVAEAHRGRIELASRPGEGSTFSLWLPLTGGGETASAATAEAASEAQG